MGKYQRAIYGLMSLIFVPFFAFFPYYCKFCAEDSRESSAVGSGRYRYCDDDRDADSLCRDGVYYGSHRRVVFQRHSKVDWWHSSRSGVRNSGEKYVEGAGGGITKWV